MSDFGAAELPCSKCGGTIKAKLIRIKLSDNRVVYDSASDTVHSVTREYAEEQYNKLLAASYHTAAEAAYGSYLEDFNSSFERYHCGTAVVFLADFNTPEYTQACIGNVNNARVTRGISPLSLTTDDAKMTFSYLSCARSYFDFVNRGFGTGIFSTYNRPCYSNVEKYEDRLAKFDGLTDLTSPEFLYRDGWVRPTVGENWFMKTPCMLSDFSDVVICFAGSLNTLDDSIMSVYDTFVTPQDLCYTFCQSVYFRADSIVTADNTQVWSYDGSNDQYYIDACVGAENKEEALDSINPYN